MSCIITYKGQKYSEEQFKEYFINNKQEFVTSITKNKDVIDSFKRKMEGIDFVFNHSPELASIGSKAQYLQYLSTIFKTSKVKDIVYRGGNGGISSEQYFSKQKEYAERYSKRGGNVKSYIVNLTNPIYFDKGIHRNSIKGILNDRGIIGKDYDGSTSDSIIEMMNGEEPFSSKGKYDVIVVNNIEQIHLLGSKADIQGFKEFVRKSSENSIQFNVSPNEVSYQLKSIEILSSQKADEIFRKGDKNGWSIDKILTELQIPKEQKQLLLSFNTRNREELLTNLLANYSYTVEINTAKEQDETKTQDNIFTIGDNRYELKYKSETGNKYFKNNQEISENEFIKANNEYINSSPTKHYSNLTVPGGTNGSYREVNIESPLITLPKSHAQFNTEHTLMFARMDDAQAYSEKDIEKLISLMENNEQLEIKCD